VELKFKKLHKDAVLPSYALKGDAGLDLTAVEDGERKDSYVQYKLGIAVEIPKGHVGLLFPRSSISKMDLMQANAVGVIDSGYRDEVMVRYKILPSWHKLIYIGVSLQGKLRELLGMGAIQNAVDDEYNKLYRYKKGDRVGQLIVVPYPECDVMWTDTLSESPRKGGFGHTGK
jgi:dUTP pyrophosphatase